MGDDPDYRFVSQWAIPATTAQCWEAVERDLTGRGTPWWPAVTVEQPPAVLAPGESFVLAVRSPLGYRLRVRLTITLVEKGARIAVESAGDLRGTGEVVVAAAPAGTDVTIAWAVSPTVRWMRATAFALRPAFVWAHTRVMAAGERGMRRALDVAS